MLRDSNYTSSMLAFFAFIMAGIEAIFGVLSLRSDVMIPGGLNLMVWSPESIYLVTIRSPSTNSTLEAKVA